jgi:hypothetical protein
LYRRDLCDGDTMRTRAIGTAERGAVVTMLARMRDRHRFTLAADKNYGTTGFVAALREMELTEQVVRNNTNQHSG